MTKGQKLAERFLAGLDSKTREDALEYVERFAGLTTKERKNLGDYDLQTGPPDDPIFSRRW